MTFLCCTQKSTAKVVDGKLILSLPNAVQPIVWQMDLGDVKASALEVKDGNDQQVYVLTLKTPKGENMDVASFSRKSQAVQGLMAASKALESAHGQIRPGGVLAADRKNAAGVYTEKRGGGKKTLFWIILILISLFFVWMAMLPKPSNTVQSSPSASSAEAPAGVPLSADEFLRGQ